MSNKHNKRIDRTQNKREEYGGEETWERRKGRTELQTNNLSKLYS